MRLRHNIRSLTQDGCFIFHGVLLLWHALRVWQLRCAACMTCCGALRRMQRTSGMLTACRRLSCLRRWRGRSPKATAWPTTAAPPWPAQRCAVPLFLSSLPCMLVVVLMEFCIVTCTSQYQAYGRAKGDQLDGVPALSLCKSALCRGLHVLACATMTGARPPKQKGLRRNLVVAGGAGSRPGAEEGGSGSGGGGSRGGGRQRLRRRAGKGGEDRGEDCQNRSGCAQPVIEARMAAWQGAVCMRMKGL